MGKSFTNGIQADGVVTIVAHHTDATDAVVSELEAELVQGGGKSISVSLNGSKVNDLVDALIHITEELRIMNLHMSAITGEDIERKDVEDVR
tara:strand:- start:1846 stop:2121 length:276 start_codon:yes stop_codon:yes gene_type:complete